MAIQSWPFAGEPTTDLQYSRLMRELAPIPMVADTIGGPALAVTANSTAMAVSVGVGEMVIRGCVLQVTDPEILPIAAAGTTGRVDRVVARLSQAAVDNEPRITLAVKTGSGDPPGLDQTDDGVFEVSLARVVVPANATVIAAANIADERPYGPVWTTSARPGAPRTGLIGWNATNGHLEWWTGSAWASILSAGAIPSLDASKITSGTLGLARIPNLDAARIPNLDAAKVTSGTLALARIPTLDAARVPNLDAAKISSGTLPITRGGTGATTAAAARANLGITPANIGAFPAVGGTVPGTIHIGERLYVNGLTILPGAYDTTTSQAPNAVIAGGSTPGTLYRSTSSARYKQDIRNAKVAPDLLTRLIPRSWLDRAEVERHETGDGPKPTRHIGLVAEEVVGVGGDQFVTFDDEGRPDALAYDRLIVAVVAWAKTQDLRAAALEAEVMDLKLRFAALEGQVG